MIEEKLNDFILKDLKFKEISDEELKTNNIVIRRSSGLMYEKSVRIYSEFIPNPSSSEAFFGAYSYMNGGGYFRGGGFIGRYCSIGRRVSLGAGSHHMDWPSTSGALLFKRGRAYTPDEAVSVRSSGERNAAYVINSDAWIGDGAVVLPGITIGVGAVVGANSFVNCDVQPYAIVGGIPAKLIAYRFDADVRRRLIESKWWNYDKQDIDNIATSNVFDFLLGVDVLQSKQTRLAHYQTWK